MPKYRLSILMIFVILLNFIGYTRANPILVLTSGATSTADQSDFDVAANKEKVENATSFYCVLSNSKLTMSNSWHHFVVLENMPMYQILTDCLHESLTSANLSLSGCTENKYIEAYLVVDVSFQGQFEDVFLPIPSSVVKGWIGNSNSNDIFIATPYMRVD